MPRLSASNVCAGFWMPPDSWAQNRLIKKKKFFFFDQTYKGSSPGNAMLKSSVLGAMLFHIFISNLNKD